MSMSKNSLLGIEGLLVFQINGREYCSDISSISVVLKLNEANLHGFQQEKGTLQFQNREYRIIDIHEMLKIGNKPVTSGSKIILFRTSGIRFGFLVNKIVEIITVDSSFVENSLDFIPYTNEEFICGELVIRERRILFLDSKRLSANLKDLNKLTIPSLYVKVTE